MSDDNAPAGPEIGPVAELRARAEVLERQLAEVERETRERVARAELKVEAVRAGIVDLDGLKLLDFKSVEFSHDGNLINGAHMIAQLRQAKPWLFSAVSSSSSASPPPAQAPRLKLATEMTDDEYRVARAAIVKQRW